MREDIKLSETILKIIADKESYPAHIEPSDIRNNDAIKENFKNISDGKIVFHAKMLEEEGLIEAEFRDKKILDNMIRLVNIIGLTKKGSNYIKYIESSLWEQTMKDLKNAKKPLTMELAYSVCEKLINK